ncbi:unnamed protein product [Arabidopsis lyrata]|nr:unnamed protein product [Arabidopsis lyrata]
MTLRSRSEHRLSGGDKHKDNVNALLLVANLVATVAFAAGFTIPGGFSSAPPNLGMANELDFCYFLSPCLQHFFSAWLVQGGHRIAAFQCRLQHPNDNCHFLHVMVLLLGPYVIPQLPGVPFLQPVTGLYLQLLLLFVNEEDYVSGSGHTCEKKRVKSEDIWNIGG